MTDPNLFGIDDQGGATPSTNHGAGPKRGDTKANNCWLKPESAKGTPKKDRIGGMIVPAKSVTDIQTVVKAVPSHRGRPQPRVPMNCVDPNCPPDPNGKTTPPVPIAPASGTH